MSTAISSTSLEAQIAEALGHFGYRFEVREGTDFYFQICTAPGEFWRAQILAHPDVVQLHVYLTDARYLEQHQSLVLELVCRLNDAASVLGSWEFEWDGGAVRFHSALDLRGQHNVTEAVSRHLNALKFPISLWSRCYSQVGESNASAKAIVSASLIGEGCHHQRVTDEVRRLLLRLHRPETHSYSPSPEVERNVDIVLKELGVRSSE